MKKLIFIAAFAAAILPGCTKNQVNPAVPDQPISFTTAVGSHSTKADEIINDAVYPEDETFGTYAWYNATETNFPTEAKEYIPNSEVVYNTNVAGEWSTGTAYYWPNAGSLTFISYSPYDELNGKVEFSTNDGIKISDWNVMDNQTVDVMVADIISGQTSNGSNSTYNGVPTIFRHKLSQIAGFTFKTDMDYDNDDTPGNGDKRFFITGISIDRVDVVGTYTSGIPAISGTSAVQYDNGGSWTSGTTTDSYIWYENAAAATDPEAGVEFTAEETPIERTSTTATDKYLLVLPQEFADNDSKTITINYTIRTYTSASSYSDDNVTEKIELFDIHASSPKWDLNKKITYNFTVSLQDNRILWAPSVEEWEEESADFEI